MNINLNKFKISFRNYLQSLIIKIKTNRSTVIIMGVASVAFMIYFLVKKVRASPIKNLKKCRTPSSLSYYLVNKCYNDRSVKNVMNNVTKDPETFLSDVRSDCKKASLFNGLFGNGIDSDMADRLVVVYEYIREYAELKGTVLKLRKSTDFDKYTDLLKNVMLPKGENDWTTVGFQREESPNTDYRGAGCLAPIMLYSLLKLDKKFVHDVIEGSKRDGDKSYMFASINIGIIYKQSELLEKDDPSITSYLFGEKDKGVDTDINPFDKIKEMGGKNLINRRYALHYQYLSTSFDKYFHDSNGSLMQSQMLLDRFFEDVKKGKY